MNRQVGVKVAVHRWDDEACDTPLDFTLLCDVEVQDLDTDWMDARVLRIVSDDGIEYYAHGGDRSAANEAIGARNNWSATPYKGSWLVEIETAAMEAIYRTGCAR